MVSDKELIDRPIPGVTARQMIILATFFGGCIIAYIDIKNGMLDNRRQGKANYELMIEIKEEFKQDRKMDDARLRLMELQINECKTRLDIMDKFIEGYSKPQK